MCGAYGRRLGFGMKDYSPEFVPLLTVATWSSVELDLVLKLWNICATSPLSLTSVILLLRVMFHSSIYICIIYQFIPSFLLPLAKPQLQVQSLSSSLSYLQPHLLYHIYSLIFFKQARKFFKGKALRFWVREVHHKKEQHQHSHKEEPVLPTQWLQSQPDSHTAKRSGELSQWQP
jgi:hypothetical protein